MLNINFLEVFIKKLKSNLTQSFLLVFYLVLFVLFGFYFIKDYSDREPILKIIVSLVWSLMAISYAILNWRKLIREEPENQSDNTPKNKIFSQNWRARNLPETIAIRVLLIPVIVLSIIIFSNDEYTKTYIASDPSYETTGDWANILVGVGLIAQALEEIVSIKQKIIQRILELFNSITILLGFILYLVYAIHFTEIT